MPVPDSLEHVSDDQLLGRHVALINLGEQLRVCIHPQNADALVPACTHFLLVTVRKLDGVLEEVGRYLKLGLEVDTVQTGQFG